MGTSATTIAYGIEDGLKNYEQIKALVSVQPLTYAKFVKAMGVPDFLVKRANKPIMEKTGIDFSQNTFMPYVKDIQVPTLVIQNRNDPWTSIELVKAYYEALQVDKKMLWLDLSKQRAAAYDWIGKNSKDILEFYKNYL